MDKPALLGIARRRWYLLFMGVLASAVLGFAATLASPPTYNARALVMLLPSQTTVGEDGNPFLELSGLELPARVVVAALSSTSVREEIGKQYPDITYAATIEESTRGPIVAIDVTGSSDQATLTALPPLIQEATSTLERLQNEVDTPPEATVRAMVLAQDATATADRSGTVRLAIAAVALGIVATVLGASAIDGRMRQRRARFAASEELDAPAGGEPVPDAVVDEPADAPPVTAEARPAASSDPADATSDPGQEPDTSDPLVADGSESFTRADHGRRADPRRSSRPRNGKARSRKPR